jgi:hypothetical protein
MHINTYKYILSHTYIDAYKYMVNEDANWLGCGGRRSEHYRRCWEGIVETLALTVIVTRASPHDVAGVRPAAYTTASALFSIFPLIFLLITLSSLALIITDSYQQAALAV